MKKLSNNSLVTTNKTSITVEDFKGHLKVRIKHKEISMTVTTSVKANLTAFERKAALVHFYKLLEHKLDTGNDKVTLRQDLKCCNYAQIFGSPWN